jgi:hypothetical protein
MEPCHHTSVQCTEHRAHWLLILGLLVTSGCGGGAAADLLLQGLGEEIACRPISQQLKQRLQRDLVRDYTPSFDGCRLRAAFPACLPTRDPVQRVVVSHGDSTWYTEIYELIRDGSHFSVTRIRIGPVSDWWVDRPRHRTPVQVARGRVAVTGLARQLDEAWVLLGTTLSEERPFVSGGGGWGSSGRNHAHLLLERGSTAMENAETGGFGSFGQTDYLPIYRATSVLIDALNGKRVHYEPASSKAGARAFFWHWYASRQEVIRDSGWVLTHLLGAAETLGNREMAPLILEDALRASKRRDRPSQDAAIAALAALTGTDLRQGDARPLRAEILAGYVALLRR